MSNWSRILARLPQWYYWVVEELPNNFTVFYPALLPFFDIKEVMGACLLFFKTILIDLLCDLVQI